MSAASKPQKKRLTNSGRWRKRRDDAKKGLALLPSLLTLGNAICGIAAIVKIAKIQWEPDGLLHEGPFGGRTNLYEAALLILLGMVFDVLDGRVARLTKTTSDFGGQLDSLADAVTFGVAPGIMAIMANAEARFPLHPFWTKVAWVFGIAYSCGAIARLARFNVGNDHDDKAHMEFKGLPSPGAAGVIATLVLLQGFLLGPRGQVVARIAEPEVIDRFAQYGITLALPFVALTLGYLMVSKFRYTHVANRFLRGRKPFYYLRIILLGGVFFAILPEVMGALVFIVFAATGPLLAWRQRGLAALAASPAAETPAAPAPNVAATVAEKPPETTASEPPPQPAPSHGI
jgi:CDP-diacylglycerol--serine O-phosphatidyltransferase